MAENLRNLAYQRFTEKLFNSEIRPGDFVSQRELSQKLGVPLGPVREALKRLETENFVKLVAQRGIQVCPIDYDMIEETFGLRTVLELAALENFVANAPDEVIDRLIAQTRSIYDDLAKYDDSVLGECDADLLGETRKTDRLLHDTLIASMNNSIISDVYALNFAKIRLIRLNGKHLPLRSRQIMKEHLEVLNAVKMRDTTTAKAALRHHLVISHRRALGQTESM